MKWRWLIGLLLPVYVGCSNEGGITGTGISTVSGSVSEVQGDAAAVREARVGAAADAAGVRVRIVEVPGLETITGADGTFVLSGDFAGAVTVQFDAPAAPPATLSIDVPAGSTVVLPDVVLRGSTPELQQPIRQRDFLGTIIMADCNPDDSGELLVADTAHQVNQFLVRITADTAILQRATDSALDCDSLRKGLIIEIEGTVEQGAIRADTITASPSQTRTVPPGDSTVSGTVLSPASGGAPRSPIAGLQVSVVGIPALETETSDSGEFVLSGQFAGPIILRFAARGMMADLALNVPAGATVILRNAVLRDTQIIPHVIRVRGFSGTVAESSPCSAASATLVVADAARPPHRFMVGVLPNTLLLRRAPGGPVTIPCRALQRASVVMVDGQVAPDGTLLADTVIVPAQ